MSEVRFFPCRTEVGSTRRRAGDGGCVLQFPQRLPIAYAAYVVLEGRKRRSWACMVHRAGDDPYELAAKTEKDARWLAGIMLKGFAEDRAIEADPIAQSVKVLLALPKDMRKAVGRKLLGLD